MAGNQLGKPLFKSDQEILADFGKVNFVTTISKILLEGFPFKEYASWVRV